MSSSGYGGLGAGRGNASGVDIGHSDRASWVCPASQLLPPRSCTAVRVPGTVYITNHEWVAGASSSSLHSLVVLLNIYTLADHIQYRRGVVSVCGDAFVRDFGRALRQVSIGRGK